MQDASPEKKEAIERFKQELAVRQGGVRCEGAAPEVPPEALRGEKGYAGGRNFRSALSRASGTALRGPCSS